MSDTKKKIVYVRPVLYPTLIAFSVIVTMFLSGVFHPFFQVLATFYLLLAASSFNDPALEIHVREEDIDEY